MRTLLSALLACAAVAVAVASPKIDTVVTIMFENRAFDHIMGYMNTLDSRITGIPAGGHSMPLDPSDPNSPMVPMGPNASYVSPGDPNHSLDGTTLELYGTEKPSNISQPTMNGFAKAAQDRHIDPEGILKCFTPGQVPVISTLAQEFALVNRMYASLPGPTIPNRLFAHSSTSYGAVNDDVDEIGLGYPQKSVYTQLEDAGLDWRVFYELVPDTLCLRDLRTPERLRKHLPFPEFEHQAMNGELPAYTWIAPNYFSLPEYPGTDQHPVHNVIMGERLMKKVYEILRASPKWNSTLLIVTYDEHGGFPDLVPPPTEGIPSPCGDGAHCYPHEFDFKRLGLRIPTILISPWIAKGVVLDEPTGPTPTSHYDLTSIPATLRDHFGLAGSLSPREEWAATFNHLWNTSTELRTDCPHTLPNPPSPMTHKQLLGEEPFHASLTGDQASSDLQHIFMGMLEGMTGEESPAKGNPAVGEAEATRWAARQVAKIMSGAHGSEPLFRSALREGPGLPADQL